MRPSLLGLGLLGSIFLAQAHAAPRATRNAAPVARLAPARSTPATRVAKPAITPTAVGKSKVITGEPSIATTTLTKSSAFDKLRSLLLPRATIKLADPTSKQGKPGTIAGSTTFKDGVSYKDVDQGYLGDCYFVAALDAVAYTHPALIAKNLKENADGSVSLKMYHQTTTGGYKSDTVKMSKQVPIGTDGKPSFARGHDPSQMWPSYFQKGFVMQSAANGGKTNAFQSIEGGLPGDAFSALTGKPSQSYSVSASLGEQLFTVMKNANGKNKPVAAWTPKKLPEGVVHADHTYTVLGVSERNGQKFVQLRNPWGFSPGTDGIFELDLASFAKTFVGMDVGG